MFGATAGVAGAALAVGAAGTAYAGKQIYNEFRDEGPTLGIGPLIRGNMEANATLRRLEQQLERSNPNSVAGTVAGAHQSNI